MDDQDKNDMTHPVSAKFLVPIGIRIAIGIGIGIGIGSFGNLRSSKKKSIYFSAITAPYAKSFSALTQKTQ